MKKTLKEDGVGAIGGGGAPTNNTGSGTDGAIAGLGGKDGEPGVSRQRKSPVLARLRRKPPVTEVAVVEALDTGIYGGRETWLLETKEFRRIRDQHRSGVRLPNLDLHENIVQAAKTRGPLVIQDALTSEVCFLRP